MKGPMESDTHPEIEGFRQLIEEGIPFNRYLGVKLVSLEPGVCRLSIPFRDDLVGDARRGALHGGVISALIDACGGFAVWSMGGLKDRIATIDLRVDYLKPAPSKEIIAESHVKLHGNRVGNVHTKIFPYDDPATIIAEGRSVYNIRRHRG